MRWRAASTSARSGAGGTVMARVYHGPAPALWSAPELESPAGVLHPVEDLGRMPRQSERFVKGLRAGVAAVGGPLDPAAAVPGGRLEHGPHQQLPGAVPAVALADVQLFQVERPGAADRWPQVRIRGHAREPR